jgi:N-methylhydantoinase B
MDMPIVYLWRGLAPDGGGAGRRRGGLSVGGVYKPHKTQGVQSGFGSRLDVPDSDGIFGGYLGALPHRVLVRDSNAGDLLAQGRIPPFDAIEGTVVPAAEMHGNMRLGPNDVLWSCAPAAGGWGDPLDRTVSDLQADLDFGAVSPAAAEAYYGAVLDGAGRVDAAATEVRREALRAGRRAWPARRQAVAAPAAGELARVGPLGDQLEVVRDAAGERWTRCRCGHVYAPVTENWREYAGQRVAEPTEIGATLRVNEALEIRCYCCPGCGRLHAVDVCRKGAPDRLDVQLR